MLAVERRHRALRAVVDVVDEARGGVEEAVVGFVGAAEGGGGKGVGHGARGRWGAA